MKLPSGPLRRDPPPVTEGTVTSEGNEASPPSLGSSSPVPSSLVRTMRYNPDYSTILTWGDDHTAAKHRRSNILNILFIPRVNDEVVVEKMKEYGIYGNSTYVNDAFFSEPWARIRRSMEDEERDQN